MGYFLACWWASSFTDNELIIQNKSTGNASLSVGLNFVLPGFQTFDFGSINV